eukprot:271329_1
MTFIWGMITFAGLQFSLLHLSTSYLLVFGINIFLFWYFALYFLTVKQWIIYYKYHWTRFTMERQWQCIINSNFASNDNLCHRSNWFIGHNHTYGNIIYVRKLCAICMFIALLICSAATYFMDHYSYHSAALWISILIIFIVLCAPIIIYVVISCKTPPFDDTFHIHWEGKANARLMALLGTVFMASNIFVTITDDLKDITFATPLCVLILYAMNHVSTSMIYNKNMRCHTATKGADLNINVLTVLSDPTALHLFMVHMSKEFSLECILSFIEINQFQTYCMGLMGGDSTVEMKVEPVSFPKNVPLSQLIEDKEIMNGDEEEPVDDMASAKMKAHKIYNKYIREEAEFAINVSYAQRNDVKDVLEDLEFLLQANITWKDLILLFEETKAEMIRLAGFSFQRFKKQAEFDQVAGKLSKVSDGSSSKIRYR